MITKQEIIKLQEHQGSPCVSLFVQTHKTMPDRMQDPIRVKDAIKEVEKKLYSEFKQEEVARLISALHNLADVIDYSKSLDALAFFVSTTLSKSFILPFKVSPKVVIDKMFATKELIHGISISRPLWVVSLSHKPTRLFKAQGGHLVEIIDDLELQQNMQGFPFSLNYDVTNDKRWEAYSVGDRDASYMTHQLDHFMHQLDDLLLSKLGNEHLPLVIIGTEKNRADFAKITRFKKDIILQIEADYTHISVHEIEILVQKHMDEYFNNEEARVLSYLNEALGKNHCVSGVKDVWRQGRIGKIRTLIIEETYKAPAYIDEKNPDEVILYDKFNTPGGYKDLAEEIVSKVFNSKGKVLFVKDGALAKFDKIAAILWY